MGDDPEQRVFNSHATSGSAGHIRQETGIRRFERNSPHPLNSWMHSFGSAELRKCRITAGDLKPPLSLPHRDKIVRNLA